LIITTKLSCYVYSFFATVGNNCQCTVDKEKGRAITALPFENHIIGKFLTKIFIKIN
jgi:hypothetical protein